MLRRPRRRPRVEAGVALAAAGAVSYGVTVVIGRDLALAGLGSATSLGIRFSVAALVLAALLALRRDRVVPPTGEWVRVLALGAIGYTAESTLFFLALERGTAAASALLFYTYPALVAVIELVRGRERAALRLLVALLLSVSGTVLVVAAGSRISITGAGILFALGSAVTYAVYLLVGREVRRQTTSLTAACWVAVGASVSSLGRGAFTGTLADPSGHWPALLLYGLTTAAAFALTFAALARIGAARTAVVMTLEAFSAVVLGALVLDEPIGAVQLTGGILILAGAVVVGGRDAGAPPGDATDETALPVETV